MDREDHPRINLPYMPNPQEKQALLDPESNIQNDLIILSTDPDDQAHSTPAIHNGVTCDGPACTQRPNPGPIAGTRYKCSKCPDIDFCLDCVLDKANPHDRSHPLMKCPTPTTLSDARRRLQENESRSAGQTNETPTIRAHKLHSFHMEGFRHLVTETILDGIVQSETETGENHVQDPEVQQMVDDLRQIHTREGKRSDEALTAHLNKRQHDVDPISDEDMARVSISFVLGDEARRKKQQEPLITAEEEKKWSEYRHHHFIRRWGLLTEAEGRDEEWWIPNPEVLDERDPGFLCEMCRHIDFRSLFTRRGLPGNTAAGPTQITLYGLGHVLTDCPCAFCRLLRRSYAEIGLLKDGCSEELEEQEFVLTVLDDGPNRGLRLDVSAQFGLSLKHYDGLPSIVIQSIDESPDRPLGGRLVGTDKADLALLKSWIDECEANEVPTDDPSEGLETSESLKLRFIDLRENRIVAPEVTPRYACLSYVWGGISQMQYTSTTRSALEAADGLCNPEMKLPQTIQDAMKVTREIGLNYLWVDALCILQDDEEDVIQNIARAGRTYGNAALNIVASTNSNPNHGLPGVSSVTRSKDQIRETVQGMCLATILHDPRRRLDDIEDSKWNSRAWTYQERQLSPRNIYFTDSEMVFMSRHATFFEDTVPVITSDLKPIPILEPFNTNPRNIEWQIWTDPTQRQYPNKAFETCDGISMMVAADPDKEDRSFDPAPTYRITRLSGPQLPGRLQDNAEGLTLWERYAKAVGQYTKRHMTFDADAVRAFAGMEYLIAQGVNTKFWHGTPEFAFDRALLWYPNEPTERRKQGDKALFPSWSWAAWKGHISYKGKGWYNSQYHGPVSIINWFQNLARDDFLAQFPVEPNSGQPMADLIDELELERLLMPLDPRELMKLIDADNDGWISHIDDSSNQHYFTHETYPGICFDYPVNLPDQEVTERPDAQGMLHFSAQTAPIRLCDMSAANFTAEPPEDDFIQIGINDENRSANYRPSWRRILYHQGYRCGFLVLNVPFDEISSTTEDQYHLAAISRDTLPEIPAPGHRGIIYRAMDPRQVQHCVSKQSREEEPLASYMPPDFTAPPDTDPVGEDGNPHWDQGRFPIRMAYPIYNVLLLRKDEDCWERVGVGKMHLHAFHLASPEGRLICLK